MIIRSTSFENSGMIPEKYTCDGPDVFPPLEISGVPAEAKSLALIVDDPDAPIAGGWDHYVGWNISPKETSISEGEAPKAEGGKNSWGETGYRGPCPPAEHHYFFRLFALNTELLLPYESSKEDLLAAMKGRILAKAELVGRYRRAGR